MPSHHLLAKAALSFLSIVQAAATLTIDLNRTHATNPGWPGHARFHLVWQAFTVTLLAGLTLVLLWIAAPPEAPRFYLACLLSALSPIGFLLAFATRSLYAGTLSDANGIPPAHFSLLGKPRSVDMNLAAVLAALLTQAAIIAIYMV